jgi:DNA-damage-inducible protein J
MTKTATVRARMEPSLKGEVEHIFDQIGISTTEAITLLFKQVSFARGLPFSINVPNEETRKVFEKTDKGVGLVKSKNADEMFKKLGI